MSIRVSEFAIWQACALANRGQDATLEEKDMVEDAARTLEDMNQKFNATRMNGEWQLLYCSESITRSSPFFWAFRKATSDFRQPFPLLPPALSEALFLITDGIPFASAGKSMQMISGLSEQNAGEMVSSVQVKLRVFDAIIPPNVGYVTTTCRLSVMNDGAFGDLKLSVLTTEVKDSTWGQLPVVGGIFESSRFPSGEALEAVKAGSSSVDMKVISPLFLVKRMLLKHKTIGGSRGRSIV